MSFDRKISRLVAFLYEASLDEAQWASIADELGDMVDAPSMLLAVCDVSTGAARMAANTANMTETSIAAWTQYYHRVDPYLDLGARAGPLVVLLGQDWIDDAKWLNSELYRDYARHIGMRHFLGSWIPLSGSLICALGLHRPEQSMAFDAVAAQSAAMFIPHLQRALRMKLRLEEVSAERDRLQALADRIDCGVLVVDRDGRILNLNRYAETILGDGQGLVARHGRVAASSASPMVNAALGRLIRGAVDVMADPQAAPGGTLALPRESGPPLSVHVAPYRWQTGHLAPAKSAAVLLVRDPSRHKVIEATLQTLFQLTKSEAAVAGGLASGLSIDEIAARHGVSRNTVRTQLSAVMAKTATERQGELVALLARIAPSAI